jgi:hypothetical protein
LTPERWFFAGLTVAMVASIVIELPPFHYLRGIVEAPVPLAPMTPLVHIHGGLFTAWMPLLCALGGIAGELIRSGMRPDRSPAVALIGSGPQAPRFLATLSLIRASCSGVAGGCLAFQAE